MAQEEWKVEVYLEPGEAWALNAGFLLTSVLDVLKNGDTQIATVSYTHLCIDEEDIFSMDDVFDYYQAEEGVREVKNALAEVDYYTYSLSLIHI